MISGNWCSDNFEQLAISYLVICGEGTDKMLNTTEEPPANTQFTAEDLPLYKAGRGIYLVLSPIMLVFGFIGKSSFCKHTPFKQCNLGKSDKVRNL